MGLPNGALQASQIDQVKMHWAIEGKQVVQSHRLMNGGVAVADVTVALLLSSRTPTAVVMWGRG